MFYSADYYLVENMYGLLYRDVTLLSCGSLLDLGMELANEFNDSVETQPDILRMLRDWESYSRTRGNTENIRKLNVAGTRTYILVRVESFFQ